MQRNRIAFVACLCSLLTTAMLGHAQNEEWQPLQKLAAQPSLARATATSDSVEIEVVIQVGTSQSFSQGLGSCFGATGYTDSDNLPPFISHITDEVTISSFGSVRACFTLSVAPDAPDSTSRGELIYRIYRGGSECRSRTILLNITTTPALTPVANFSASSRSILAGGSISFTDSSYNAITDWQWDFGDGGNSTEQHPTHVYSTPGQYTVSLTVTGPAGSDTETRENYITVAEPGTPGQQIWALGTSGAIHAPPAIADDGTIYIGSAGRSLYAVNPDGTERWRMNTDSRVYEAPVIGPDGTIYFAIDRVLWAVDPEGTIKWTFGANNAVFSPAIGVDSTIYLGSYDNNLYTLGPDGTTKWAYQTPSAAFKTPAVGVDGTIYAIDQLGGLHAIDVDGTPKWILSYVHSSMQGSPVIALDGTIYAGALHAITPDGTLKWSFENSPLVNGTPSIGEEETIYYWSWASQQIQGIDPGKSIKWTVPANFGASTPLIAADGSFYVYGSFGTEDTLYAFDAHHNSKWRFAFKLDSGGSPLPSPVIGEDGTIYVGARDGNLYAISNSRSSLANTAWPKFAQNNKNTGRNGSAPPYLISPADSTTDSALSLELEWSRVAGANAYEYQVDTRADFFSGLLTTDEITENSVQLDNLAEDETYFWRVRAHTNSDATDWSAVWQFSTLVNAPAAPLLASPPDSAAGVSLTPALHWHHSATASSYRLQVSEQEDFPFLIINRTSLTDSLFQLPTLKPNTTYYWRVAADNRSGVSDWSEVWRFTTLLLPPNQPALISPANGATDLPSSATLTWQSADDAEEYQLQLASDADFQTILMDSTGLADTTFVAENLEANTTYYWRMQAFNTAGGSGYSTAFHFTTGDVTSVQENREELPAEFNLSQNYPNPFNPETVILFDLPSPQRVVLKVYDLNGHEIATLANSALPAGRHRVSWHGRDGAGRTVPSGLYLYRLSAGAFKQTRKMNLLR